MTRLLITLVPFIYLLLAVWIGASVLRGGRQIGLFDDPRFPGIAARFIVLPAIAFAMFMATIVGAGTVLGLGEWWSLPTAFFILAGGLTLTIKFGAIMVGHVRAILRNPPK